MTVDRNVIERLRKQLITAGSEFGLHNEKTIMLSKRLDTLLNEQMEQEHYYSLQNKKNKFVKTRF